MKSLKSIILCLGLIVFIFKQLLCIQTQPNPQIPMPQAASSNMPNPTQQQNIPQQPITAPNIAPTTTPVTNTPPKTQPLNVANQTSINLQASEKEFDEIYKQLEQLNALKKDLKNQLSDTEDKLDGARKNALESKKISFEIFQKNSIADAEILVAQVDKNLQELKTLQKKLKDISVPKFETDIRKIEELCKVIQNKITELQSKGLKFQITQAQIELQKQQSKTSTEIEIKNISKTSDANQTTQDEQSVWKKSYNKITDWTATGINKTRKAWEKFKNWVYTSKDSDSDGKKNPKSVETQTQQKRIINTEAALKNVISEFDGLVKQFDEMQIFFNQKYVEIKNKIHDLGKILKSNDNIKNYFEKIEEENPTWKKALVNGFDSLVDVFYVSGKAAIKISKKVYTKTIAPVIEDIKTKIKEENKGKTISSSTTTQTFQNPGNTAQIQLMQTNSK